MAMNALTDAYSPFVTAGRAVIGQEDARRVSLPFWGGYTLLLVSDGQVRVEGPRKPLVFGPGTIAILDPRISGELQGAKGSTWRRVHFDVMYRQRIKNRRNWRPVDDQNLQPDAYGCWRMRIPTPLPENLLAEARRATLEISDRWWRSNLDLLAANARLTGFLAYLVAKLRTRSVPEAPAPTAAMRGMPDWVLSAESFARTAAEKGCSVEDLAAHVGFSRPHFSSRYRALRGEPPGTMLRRLRLDRARELLDAGRPIATVAKEAGYRSVPAFSEAFNKAYGQTPDRWRRR